MTESTDDHIPPNGQPDQPTIAKKWWEAPTLTLLGDMDARTGGAAPKTHSGADGASSFS